MSDAGGWALAEAGVGWNDVRGFRLSFGDNAPDLRFPGSSYGKESACNAGDPGSIPGSERSPGEGNGSPLQYSWLENSMDRRAWEATVHGVAKSWTQLSDCHSLRREGMKELGMAVSSGTLSSPAQRNRQTGFGCRQMVGPGGVNSGSSWWTGRPGVLQFTESQRVRHDWVTELNWAELNWTECMHARSWSKSSKLGLNSMWTENFQMFSWIQKRQRNQTSNCQNLLDHRKSKKIPENHLLLLHWLCQTLWLCGSQQTGNS